MTITLITCILCFILGFAISYLLGKSKHSALTERLNMMLEQAEEARRQEQKKEAEAEARLESTKRELRAQYDSDLLAKEKVYDEMLEAKERAYHDGLEAQEKRHTEVIAAQQQRFDETMKKVLEQATNATNDMLKRRQKEFEESSSSSIGLILNPLRETIESMKKTMSESTMRQTEMGAAMKENIDHMLKQSRAAQLSAEELTRVFKHGSKVQGDWGETVLDELLESQGLTRGIHYDTQSVIRNANGDTVKSADGSILRPDIILHLDKQREVIIDSKVSLTAFIDYVNADTPADKDKYLKAHIESLQKHVKELSAKDYSSYIQPPKVKMDYVIMFVPHSGALWTALNAQPDLWRRAMEKNVFIADEQTLFAALRIVSLTWTQISQAQNHERVYELANEMLDRVGQFIKKYHAIGKALESASKAYEDAGKKLSPNGQSIIQTCAKLQKLGARQNSRNPIPSIASAEGQEIPDLEPSLPPSSSTVSGDVQ